VKRFLAAVACCGVLPLSACSGDSSSSADPVTPSPTASSSSAEPSPTEEPESPEEFVERWVDADTAMQNSGDTDTYRLLSQGCSSCMDFADRIEAIYDSGGYVKTRGWIILKSRLSPPLDNGEQQVTIHVKSTPTEYVEAEGEAPKHLDGARVSYIVTLKPRGESWSTINAEQVAQ